MNKAINKNLIISLASLVIFALSLSLVRFFLTDSFWLWFLIWNLVLAFVPLVLAWGFFTSSKSGLRYSFKNLVLLGFWLIFLPNAFYLISDYIHLVSSPDSLLLFDAVLISTYMIIGLIFGYLSLGLIHYRFKQRNKKLSHWLVFGALLMSGYAIYLGRFLRWNSWDLILNPFAIIFDISRTLVSPSIFIEAFSTSLLFFGLLALLYIFLWRFVLFVRNFK